MSLTPRVPAHPAVQANCIHVVERGTPASRGPIRCEIGRHIEFSTASLESYFFARWDSAAYDALLIAAAVEFADVTLRRPAYSWRRDIELRVPVHDVQRWRDKRIHEALHDALAFLTGDRWQVQFYRRRKRHVPPEQGLLSLSPNVTAVLPFSNGLDSCAVAGLTSKVLGSRLVRIRLGSGLTEGEGLTRQRQAFTSVPYKVRVSKDSRRESTARSRGFKFALISGIAAYLADAQSIIVPESGQGALGPVLLTVGQAYEDYRSYPLFTRRMEVLLRALFDRALQFTFPQLWETKAETLRRFVNECGDSSWSATWSCWQQNRHVSVSGKKRQCGVCAACMLRRMSIHAARLAESSDRYVWENLSASTFEKGAAPSFAPRKITNALREYAIAGVLHMDHFSGLLQSKANAPALDLVALQLADALTVSPVDSRAKLDRLVRQHAAEWADFRSSLGKGSFIAEWAGARL
jgi:7-cyano-7-deazaguanine synthase in queuosine biosynthesis